ncbi:hypothetical protein V8E54_006210 [Elaphomyces granulatus]
MHSAPLQCRSPSNIGVPFLPRDLFLIILGYLDVEDIIRCRRVSKTWCNAFGEPINLILLLQQRFRHTREVRKLQGGGAFDHANLLIPENASEWRKVFDGLAARYYHLARGMPRLVRKLKLCQDQHHGSTQWYPVQPFNVHASNYWEAMFDLRFPHAFWTYEDGLLVYPDAQHSAILLMDVEADATFMVPFAISDRIIRRLRLQDRLLVIEWAESEPFHWVNDSDQVHRHYATSFMIERTAEGWKVDPWNEWKIMFLGHPLSDRDRFFSSHNQHYYVIYSWQPNRSLYTADEDAPIESMVVWDISQRTPYRPSLDPHGNVRDAIPDDGPSIVARFSFRELDFYSVRQRGCPSIVRLDIDRTGSIEITDNTFCRFASPGDEESRWKSKVQTTSIPFIGYGPCWQRDTGVPFPAYRGNCELEAVPLGRWYSWYLCLCEVTDHLAQVSFTLQVIPTSEDYDDNHFRGLEVIIRTPISEATMNPIQTSEISFTGKISGDERFVIGENNNNEVVIFTF